MTALATAFPDAEIGVSADGHAFVRVRVEAVVDTLRRIRDELGYRLLVDLTAWDEPPREDRFELNYLVHSLDDHTWLRVKARTGGIAPSAVAVYPGLDWFEREVFDLFGVRFEGHPSLTRIMMPDDWVGHPLRRDEPIRHEPVDFTVTRDLYGT